MSAYQKFAFGTIEVEHDKANIAASQTAAELVPAVPGKRILVLAIAFVCGATATNATLNSASTAISPLFANAANGGAVLPENPVGWCKTEVGEALTLTTGAGATTGVLVVWVPV